MYIFICRWFVGWCCGCYCRISNGRLDGSDWAAMTNQRDRCFVLVCFEIWLESFSTTFFFGLFRSAKNCNCVMCLLLLPSPTMPSFECVFYSILLAFSLHSSIINFFFFFNISKKTHTSEYLLTKSFQIVNVLAIKFQGIRVLSTLSQDFTIQWSCARMTSHTNMCGARDWKEERMKNALWRSAVLLTLCLSLRVSSSPSKRRKRSFVLWFSDILIWQRIELLRK